MCNIPDAIWGKPLKCTDSPKKETSCSVATLKYCQTCHIHSVFSTSLKSIKETNYFPLKWYSKFKYNLTAEFFLLYKYDNIYMSEVTKSNIPYKFIPKLHDTWNMDILTFIDLIKVMQCVLKKGLIVLEIIIKKSSK